jgi:hypothetical protein
MKAGDLMIGDKFWRPACVDQVVEIRKDGVIGLDPLRGLISFNEIEPIILTPEVLIKNNFLSDCDKKYYKNKNWSNLIIRHCIECYEKDFCVGEMLDWCDSPQFHVWYSIKYFHEFQHTLKQLKIEITPKL